MSYELKNCPICGAGELKKTGIEEKDGQLFGLYKCPSCDASLSAYDKYFKLLKAAQKNNPKTVEQPKSTSTEPLSSTLPQMCIKRQSVAPWLLLQRWVMAR